MNKSIAIMSKPMSMNVMIRVSVIEMDSMKRDFTTRVGTLELKVLRTQDGKFSHFIFEHYHRNKKELSTFMLEIYIIGVSTRKVTKNSGRTLW